MCVDLDATMYSDHWGQSSEWGSNSYGKHLVFQSIVVSIVDDKVEYVSDGLRVGLKWGDVPAGKTTLRFINIFIQETRLFRTESLVFSQNPWF